LRGYLLDTHTWFWFLIGSDRLPRGLNTLIDQETRDCWLSPISVWELALLAHRGRVRIDEPFRDWFARAMELLPLREASMNFEVTLMSREVQLPHEDPADHFIASTALVYELDLLTVDGRLTGADWLPTRST
jgi:PIN domain nuclease of toxin-antitoxin system